VRTFDLCGDIFNALQQALAQLLRDLRPPDSLSRGLEPCMNLRSVVRDRAAARSEHERDGDYHGQDHADRAHQCAT
jgi:hypothetical protein